ncbi:hypothetical protein [Pseudofrankia asymbiotica]|uniref:hypothetical protein n=1 Tax=Pseudofrankia asymbiotica TaxID=1834516 RepID=UPI001F523AB1|nr:hypothetical protein [Pseudofrankia asymbiotica]
MHIPENGADSRQVLYKINMGTGTVKTRAVNQHWEKDVWFDLGSYQLSAGASVSLSNVTDRDWHDDNNNPVAVDVSWDAVAFTPSSKPAVDYVALGDSYSAGQGVEPYYGNDDCHRSPQAYPTTVFSTQIGQHPETTSSTSSPAAARSSATSGAPATSPIRRTRCRS